MVVPLRRGVGAGQPTSPNRCRAFVLADAGVLGFAWMLGALAAFEAEAMGINLMDPRPRTEVLETAVHATAQELRGQSLGRPRACAVAADDGRGGSPA